MRTWGYLLIGWGLFCFVMITLQIVNHAKSYGFHPISILAPIGTGGGFILGGLNLLRTARREEAKQQHESRDRMTRTPPVEPNRTDEHSTEQ